ncbi:MAG: DUF4129 domain-containing protein [Acidimicrobiales bacterium]
MGSVRTPRGPAAGAILALAVVVAVVALGATGTGLLVPGTDLGSGLRAPLRLLGLGAAVVAIVALVSRFGGAARVPSGRAPAVVGAAALVTAALALATYGVSDVGLDLDRREAPSFDPGGEGGGGDRGETAYLIETDANGSTVVRDADGVVVARLDSSSATLDFDATRLVTPDGATIELDVESGESTTEVRLPTGATVDRVHRDAESGGATAAVVTLTDGTVVVVGNLPAAQLPGGASVADDLRVDTPPGDLDGSGRDDDPDLSLPGWLWWVLGGVGLALVAAVLLRYRPAPATEEADADDEPMLPSDAEAGLAASLEAMLSDPDPRPAIIAAYARLLEVLEDAGGGRRPEEAPHEHLHRVLSPLGVHPAPVHRLAELFVMAKFTTHDLTEADRSAAIAALEVALADALTQPDQEA